MSQFSAPHSQTSPIQTSRSALSQPNTSFDSDAASGEHFWRGGHFVARAAETLAGSLDYEHTLEQLSRLAVPFLGDWCCVVLLEGETYRCVSVAHQDDAAAHGTGRVGASDDMLAGELEERIVAVAAADKVAHRTELAARLRRVFALREDATFGMANVLNRGEAELCREVDETWIGRARQDDEHEKLLRDLQLRSVLSVPLNAQGRVLGALTFLICGENARRYDESDVSLAQDLARVAALALDNARLFCEAEAANRAKDEFLNVLSHELRTPLTAILGWIYLLRGDGFDPTMLPQALEVIEKNARAQERLIEDLIDLSQIVAGKLSLNRRPLDLCALVSHCVNEQKEKSSQQSAAEALQWNLFLPPAGEESVENEIVPIWVLGDELRLRQALGHLLSNAQKFTPSGGHIAVRVESSGVSGQVAVTDSGQGFEVSQSRQLFDLFQQADSSATRASGGLGMGLTIVRHIARLHGGDARAHSDGSGHGATFLFELPLLPFVPAFSPKNDVMTEVKGSETTNSLGALCDVVSLEGAQILVVSADETIRQTLQTMLRRGGAHVEILSALENWPTDVSRFQALIFDLTTSFPSNDGLNLMRQLRALSPLQGADVPAAAVVESHSDEARILASGFDGCLRAPIEAGELAVAVLQLLAIGRQRQQ